MITLTTEGEPGTGYLVTGEYKTSEEFFKEVNEVQGIDAPVKTASRLVTSKSLARFVDAYFRITHKENPKQVYALFSDNPTSKFEDVSNGAEVVIKFKDSLNDSINASSQGASGAAAAQTQAQSSDVKMSAAAKVAQYKDTKDRGEDS